jgi:hypothetical protein
VKSRRVPTLARSVVAFVAAATRALAFDECVECALFVLESTPEHYADAAPVAALGRLVRDRKLKVNKRVKALARAMEKRSCAGRAEPLLGAIAASTEARAKSLAEVLFDLRDEA